MEWLSPLWLGASAAVVLPIIIHLRRRQPPEVVRVGSTADLVASTAAHRRRRITDLPLLLVRCAVLVVAAVLLAGPRVEMGDTAGRQVAVVAGASGSVTDSLRRAGIPVASVQSSDRLWSLATWADTALAAGDTLLLIDRSGSYSGLRPRLRHPAVLHGSPPPIPSIDTKAVAIVAASRGWDDERDSVAALLASVASKVPLVIKENASDTLLVGAPGTPWVDSAALAGGALTRPDFIDSLVASLIPPTGVTLPPAHMLPGRAGGDGASRLPLRDARPMVWWLLVAAIGVERVLASKRRRA